VTVFKKILLFIIVLLVSMPCGPVTAHQKTPHAGNQGELQTSPDEGPGFELPEPGTYQLPTIQEAADGEVLDADGKRHRLLDLMGDKYVLLSFIYTGCADPRGCPLAVFMMNEIRLTLDKDPDLSERVLLLTLSFDTEHDRPEVMRDFSETHGFEEARAGKRWLFLTTSSEKQLKPILDGYGQYVVPEIDATGKNTGRYSHVLKVFLIDLERRVRNVYSTSFLYKGLIVNDIKTLILEKAGSR
jgi:cytochrome c peroxidase